MTGLELSKKYFMEYGVKMLSEKFPECYLRTAAGLVGEGSQCYGYDDDISTDHDWGPGFCVWLNDDDYKTYGSKMQSEYEKLPLEYEGITFSDASSEWKKRLGVYSINGFYRHFIGKIPDGLLDWLYIPETYLSVVTNGEVFTDEYGEFTNIRNTLLKYYPEDIRIKKIAARAAIMSQSGQYNYERCMRRKDSVAAEFAIYEFSKAAISMLYLLDKKYMPFYKWAHHGLYKTNHPESIIDLFYRLLCEEKDYSKRATIIETLCSYILDELKKQGLTEGDETFLQWHLQKIISNIKSEEIKNRNILEG